MALTSLRILVVEDEAAHAEAIQRSLETLEGAEVRVLETLAEFRKGGLAWEPDLALMDLNLPDGRAVEVLGDPTETRAFPIIVMTSFGSEQSAVEALKAGAFDYLLKSPEVFATLSQTVERHLLEWQLSTQTRRMHRELAASEAKFRSLTESSSDFIMRYDPEGRHTYLNPAALTMLGLPSEAILGKTHLECGFPPDLCHFWESRIEQVFRTGLPLQVEFEFEAPEGLVTHDWHLAPELDAAGRVHSVLGVSRDITERKRTEAALRLSELKQSAMIANISDVITIVGADLIIKYKSPNVKTWFGWEVSELVGTRALDNLHPDEVPAIRERFSLELALPGASMSGQCRFRCRDGRYRWTEFTAVNLMNDPHIAGYLLNYHDITARRQAEEDLRASKELFAKVFASSPDAININRLADGVYVAVNDGFTRLSGYLPEEVVGRASSPEGLSIWAQLEDREKLVEGLRADGQVIGLEARFRRKDGGEIVGLMSAKLLDIEGEPSVLSITRDITERKEAEDARRHLEAQLQHSQKMESLGLLAGGIAHDMNNVLGAILGLATAHLELHPPDSPAHRAFDTIVKASTRGGKLVKGLLGLSRKGLAEEEELDLNALVREEVHLLERTTLARVRLTMDLAEALPPIRGDGGALSHALMNLCVNAVDAMPENGCLTLRTRRSGAMVEVEVEDNGSGMPPEVREKALEPFFTTKPLGQGTGLGLSIVYSTVKAHRGVMELFSEAGQGTRILLRFPTCGPPPTADDSAPPTLSGPDAQKVSPHMHVLLVDDDELVSTSVKELIELLGYRTTLAFSGEEALAKLEAGLGVDVVILDMNMPGLGGAGTLPLLRALRPALPVLLATGRVEQAVLDLASAHPGVSLLSKPFTMGELRERLRVVAPA